MKKKGVANLGVGNGTLKNAQIHSIGTQNGNRVAVIYADNPYGQKQWYIQPLEGIKTVKPVNVEPVEYNYNLPSFKSIQNVMDNITIDKTEIAQSNDFRSLIMGRKWVMINYNDEMEGAKTGARQCMVVAWGISMAGNECIRIYERFGANRHDDVSPIPNYRILLTSRIINLRVIDYMEPWNDSDLDGRYNWAGDDGMSTVYEWYH